MADVVPWPTVDVLLAHIHVFSLWQSQLLNLLSVQFRDFDSRYFLICDKTILLYSSYNKKATITHNHLSVF